MSETFDYRDAAIQTAAVALARWQLGPFASVMNDDTRKEIVERAAVAVDTAAPILRAELQAERDALRAALDRVLALCEAADQRGRASLPPGTTLSGCEPLHALISPSAVRAAIAGSPQNEEPA